MNLFESIDQRKSCRSYTMEPLSEPQLEEIHAAIAGFDQLYPDVKLDYRLATETKGLYRVKAPHYLVVSGNGQKGEKESAGFLFEQLVLWFDAMGIGCVWLGEAKDAQNYRKDDLITIAFGPSDESVHRKKTEFKRKAIEEITNDPQDPCIGAVHLAPSGMNLQPWFLEKRDDKVLLYKKNLKPPLSFLYKKVDVDMGIALCHYALACRQMDVPFQFKRSEQGPSKKGYELFGEIYGIH
ncbi:nitroreductase [Clostridiales Family XIII bacterium PM5-7]